jgi:hypothetical protein
MVYSMSMSFRPKHIPGAAWELSLGYLDDLLAITIGVNDAAGYLVEVELEDVLQGHRLCEDILRD